MSRIPPGRCRLCSRNAFLAQGWRLHQTLVWVKDALVLGHADYHYGHEPMLYGYKPGDGRLGRGADGWYGDNRQTSVLEVPRPKASGEHPTMKPPALIEIALSNSSQRGDLVLDPFAGSGSTLIACERTGRSARLIELDPGYCDVIRAATSARGSPATVWADGAPTKLTPEVEDLILKALKAGNYLSTAARFAGIHPATFTAGSNAATPKARGEQDRLYRDFAAKVDQAMAEAEVRAASR